MHRAFTIPVLQRILKFSCEPNQFTRPIELSTVSQRFRETIVDFQTAALIWPKVMTIQDSNDWQKMDFLQFLARNGTALRWVIEMLLSIPTYEALFLRTNNDGDDELTTFPWIVLGGKSTGTETTLDIILSFLLEHANDSGSPRHSFAVDVLKQHFCYFQCEDDEDDEDASQEVKEYLVSMPAATFKLLFNKLKEAEHIVVDAYSDGCSCPFHDLRRRVLLLDRTASQQGLTEGKNYPYKNTLVQYLVKNLIVEQDCKGGHDEAVEKLKLLFDVLEDIGMLEQVLISQNKVVDDSLLFELFQASEYRIDHGRTTTRRGTAKRDVVNALLRKVIDFDQRKKFVKDEETLMWRMLCGKRSEVWNCDGEHNPASFLFLMMMTLDVSDHLEFMLETIRPRSIVEKYFLQSEHEDDRKNKALTVAFQYRFTDCFGLVFKYLKKYDLFKQEIQRRTRCQSSFLSMILFHSLMETTNMVLDEIEQAGFLAEELTYSCHRPPPTFNEEIGEEEYDLPVNNDLISLCNVSNENKFARDIAAKIREIVKRMKKLGIYKNQMLETPMFDDDIDAINPSLVPLTIAAQRNPSYLFALLSGCESQKEIEEECIPVLKKHVKANSWKLVVGVDNLLDAEYLWKILLKCRMFLVFTLIKCESFCLLCFFSRLLHFLVNVLNNMYESQQSYKTILLVKTHKFVEKLR